MKTEILNTIANAKHPVHMELLAKKFNTSTRIIRKHVHELRSSGLINGKLLIASIHGYYLSDKPTEIQAWKKKTYNAALSQLKLVSKAKKYLTAKEKSKLKNLFDTE
jgi:DeoR/GlpR family transcriptional regulator of sugar metabolism